MGPSMERQNLEIDEWMNKKEVGKLIESEEGRIEGKRREDCQSRPAMMEKNNHTAHIYHTFQRVYNYLNILYRDCVLLHAKLYFRFITHFF